MSSETVNILTVVVVTLIVLTVLLKTFLPIISEFKNTKPTLVSNDPELEFRKQNSGGLKRK